MNQDPIFAELCHCAERAKAWLWEACFPLWSRQGVGTEVFRESLDLDHLPMEAQSVRVRVQARQTYVFSAAWRLGWDRSRAEALTDLGVRAMLARCRRADGLFARRIGMEGSERIDDTADLYDTAFCLFAFAHASQMDALRETCKTAILETTAAIETYLSDPTGGFAEALPRPPYRLQNPHMHLLEAFLTAHRAFPQAGFLERAEALVRLALTRFIDEKTGVLGEYFERDWTYPEGERGERVEPGHQFEWVWLLDQMARATGAPDLMSEALDLYQIAIRTLDTRGRAVMAVTRTGEPLDPSRRTWIQTEALKAHLALWSRGYRAAGKRAVASFEDLMTAHLTQQGGWRDHLDAADKLISENMPASTGYHVVLAFEELIGLQAGSRGKV